MKLQRELKANKLDEKILITVYANGVGFNKNSATHIYLPNANPESNSATGAYFNIEGSIRHLQTSLKNTFLFGILDCGRDKIDDTQKDSDKFFGPNGVLFEDGGSVCIIHASPPDYPAFVSHRLIL